MKLFRLLALLFPLAAGAATTDPVGLAALKLRGNSDTIVSLPLLRPALASGAIQSTAPDQLTMALTVPALPTDSGAYVLVLTGALEGAVFPITSFDGQSTLTVSPGTYSLGSLQTETANGTGHGDLAAIVPYWTLDTVFPSGAGINPSASPTVRNTEIQLYNAPAPGTSQAASAIFFYFAGNSAKAAGWYQVGNTATALGNQRLSPGGYFVVRNKIAGDQTVYLSGCVQMAGFNIAVGTLAANTAQDNLLGLPIGAGLSATLANLVGSGAFAASPNGNAIADELLTFDNTVVALNKVPSATYYYCNGASGQAAGWYEAGDATTPVALSFAPGQGFIIRKEAAAAAQTLFWTGVPPYLQE
jgi:uncharacterized protein (TIGR02597 family)